MTDRPDDSGPRVQRRSVGMPQRHARASNGYHSLARRSLTNKKMTFTSQQILRHLLSLTLITGSTSFESKLCIT